MTLHTTLFLFCAFFYLPTYAKEPAVDLGYSVYKGTSLNNGQNQFLGIRFAAPPLGNLRFRKPQVPLSTKNVQAATAFGPFCLSVQGPLDPVLLKCQGEDCLFLNVWAPSTSISTERFPVFFYIGGGGYNWDLDPNASLHCPFLLKILID